MTQHLLRRCHAGHGSRNHAGCDRQSKPRRLRRFLSSGGRRLSPIPGLLTGLGCIYPVTLQAAVETQANSAAVRQVAGALPDQGSYLLQVLFGLIFVLGLIFAAAWLMRRVGQGTFTPSHQMKVLAALPLGTRERVVLLDVGGQQLLLGITATTINTLHTFDEPVIHAPEKTPTADFASKIREVMARGMVKPK